MDGEVGCPVDHRASVSEARRRLIDRRARTTRQRRLQAATGRG
jgi:hypothetical protein